MKFKIFMIALMASTVLGSPSYAYQSFAATYFVAKTQRIEGKIVRFVYGNTHSFVHLEAPGASGQTQIWAVECVPGES
jgi:Family of unknown function (DUF6152)